MGTIVGLGTSEENVKNAKSAPQIDYKKVIRISTEDTRRFRTLDGPYSGEQVFYPTLVPDIETGRMKPGFRTLPRGPEGLILDELAKLDRQLMAQEGQDKPRSRLAPKRIRRFLVLQKPTKKGETYTPEVKILEVTVGAADDILALGSERSVDNPDMLMYGPITSFDVKIQTQIEAGKLRQFGTEYIVNPIPPQPLANKVSFDDRFKLITFEAALDLGIFTPEEIAVIQSCDLHPTADLTPKTPAEVLAFLREFPIFFHGNQSGAPVFGPRARLLVKRAEMLGIPFVGEDELSKVEGDLSTEAPKELPGIITGSGEGKVSGDTAGF